MSKLKDITEVKGILKDLKKTKSAVPDKEKNIMTWSAGELSAYIIKETKGMSIPKKLKFAKELDHRIKAERAKLKANN